MSTRGSVSAAWTFPSSREKPDGALRLDMFDIPGSASMTLTGGCHCGAIRYQLEGEPLHGGQALCHCSDCRRAAGAPMVGWSMFPEDAFSVTQGEAREYASSEHGRRWFCETCGTGLYYRNARNLPGLVDIQAATLDDPDAIPAVAHIQTADRVGWMKHAHRLPEFERFPGP